MFNELQLKISQLRRPLPERLRRSFILGYTAALCATGVSGKKRTSYRLAAVLMDECSPISVRVNSYKTHPLLLKYTKFPHRHAESAVILANMDIVRGNNILVIRTRKDGSIANATPCKVCVEIMRDFGIKTCYHTLDNGWDALCLD